MRSEISDELSYSDHTNDKAVSIRDFFPETWLWELIPIRYIEKKCKSIALIHALLTVRMDTPKLQEKFRIPLPAGSAALYAFRQQMVWD